MRYSYYIYIKDIYDEITNVNSMMNIQIEKGMYKRTLISVYTVYFRDIC